MITRIEISGFKGFINFSLDLQPFQVIVGHNSAGKSNLFDALILLSKLAEKDVRSAFQEVKRRRRGDLPRAAVSVRQEFDFDPFCFALMTALTMLAAKPPQMMTMPMIIIVIAPPSIIGTPPGHHLPEFPGFCF